MTATLRIYRSTDANAPVLTGQAGSLITVLDACLVNGYTGSTAAGWTKPYSATNLAAYRGAAGTIGGTAQMYLYVDDNGYAGNAGVRAYETMTGVGTVGNGTFGAGTGPFPHPVQNGTGLYLYKSSTTDATARPWILLATERTFYLITAANSTIYGQIDAGQGFLGFGAFYSYKAGDAYNCFLRAAIASGTSTSRLAQVGTIPAGQSWAAGSGVYVARAYTQVGVSLLVNNNVATYTGAGGVVMGVSYGGAYPDPITGGVKLTRVLFTENDGNGYTTERGFMPGFWNPQHNLPGNHMDTFPGTGDLSGRNFLTWFGYVAGSQGRVVFETTGSWDM